MHSTAMASNRRLCPLPPIPTPTTRTRTPTTRGMVQRCCTERTANLSLINGLLAPLKRSSTKTHLASQALKVSAGYATDPPVTRQTDLNQLKCSCNEKCTFPAASGPCIERSAVVAALVTSRYYHAGLTSSDGFSDQLPGTIQ